MQPRFYFWNVQSKKSQEKKSLEFFDLNNFFLLIIFFQAILFYIPRWLWKNWEGGKIQALMMDLDVGIIPDMEKKQKKKLLVDYLHDNIRQHNWWAYRYFFCEVLALGNVVGKGISLSKSLNTLKNNQTCFKAMQICVKM